MSQTPAGATRIANDTGAAQPEGPETELVVIGTLLPEYKHPGSENAMDSNENFLKARPPNPALKTQTEVEDLKLPSGLDGCAKLLGWVAPDFLRDHAPACRKIWPERSTPTWENPRGGAAHGD